MSLGVQLFSVRPVLGEKTEETMGKLKEIGYDSLQFYGGRDHIILFGEAAKKAGVTPLGHLSNLETYENMGKELFDLCLEYGIKDLGVSAAHKEEEAVLAYIKKVNAFAEKAHAHGLTFSYHNHAAEFIRFPSGKTAMDHYLNGFDPRFVDFMPDTYWLQAAGVDVRCFLEKTQERVKILHLKDMQYKENGADFAEIGRGNMDFAGIIKTAKKVGIPHFIVEQDTCAGCPIESMKISYQALERMGL